MKTQQRLQSKGKGTTPKITPARLRRMRKRLVAFAEDVFTSMPRKDQRARPLGLPEFTTPVAV